MSFTYIRLLCLINKDSVNKNIPTQENQHQKLTTLLAVVSFFILFNLPGVILIIWELAVFSRIQTCQSFDENTGYSTWNYIVTDLGGKNLAKLSFYFRKEKFLFPASLLLVCNSAINFMLYVVFAPRFRLIIKRTAGKYFCQRRKEKNVTVHTISISKIID